MGNYAIPNFIRLIYDGRLSDVPDDANSRRYVLGIFKALNENCGEGPWDVGIAAIGYVLGAGGGYGTEGWEDGSLLAQRHTCFSNQVRGVRGTVASIILGRSRQPINPADEKKLMALLRGDYQSALNEFDRIRREEEQARREQERARLADAANAACMKQYENNGFCGCLITAMRKLEFSNEEWRTLAGNFEMLPKVGRKHDALRGIARSCNS